TRICRCIARCRARRSGRATRACFSTWSSTARRSAPTAAPATPTRAARRGISTPRPPVVAPRYLVVAPNWIGDALMAQPLLARLRARDSGVRIDVLAPPWVAPVLRRMPEVDEVIDADLRHGSLQLGDRWRIARQIKERAYDRAIVLPNTW